MATKIQILSTGLNIALPFQLVLLELWERRDKGGVGRGGERFLQAEDFSNVPGKVQRLSVP